MAHQTPNRFRAAEPFVTLSLPKTNASKRSNGTTPLPITSGLKSTDSSSRKKDLLTNRDFVSNDKTATPTATPMSTPSKRRQKSSLPTTTTANAPPSGILILKYRKTPVSQLNRLASQEDQVATPKTPIADQTQVADHTDYLWMDGQTDRRSSIASSIENGMRSSGRVRKLTTKAQALAGTNFLPSLQKTPDIDSRTSPASSLAASNEQDANRASDQVQSGPADGKPAMTSVDEAPVESVESLTLRSSTRERKPTVRAIEMESERALRKRHASPLNTERVSKTSKKSPLPTAKPSKLRLSTADAEMNIENDREMDASKIRNNHVLEEAVEANGAHQKAYQSPSQLNSVFEPSGHIEEKVIETDQAYQKPPESPLQSNTIPELSNSVEAVPAVDQTTGTTQETPSIGNASIQQNKQDADTENVSIPPATCDLSCLSPSSRLLAFARVAADWSDSNEDSDDELDIDLSNIEKGTGEVSGLMEKLREEHCRCGLTVSTIKPTDVTRTITGNERNSPDEMAVCTANGHTIINEDGRIAATTRKSQESAGERVATAKPETKNSPSRRRQTGHTDVTLKRQNSSFEQRMQADYLASQQETAATASVIGTKRTARRSQMNGLSVSTTTPAETRSVRTRASVSNVESLSFNNDVQSQDAYHKVEAYVPKTGLKRHVTAPSADVDGHTDILEALITHKKEGLPTPLQAPKPSREGSIKASSAPKSSKTGLRGAGKTSAGGSIRLSLHDKAEPEKEKMVKQQQMPLPVQPRSIKLRFTTVAK